MAAVPKLPGIVGRTDINSDTTPGAPDEVRCAVPVRGPDQWWDWARAQAWLSGRGSQLVSMGPSQKYMGSGGDAAETISIAATPHKQSTCWLWILGLSTSTGAPANGVFYGAQGTELGKWSMSAHDPDTPHHFTYLETFPSMTVSYTSYAVVISVVTTEAVVYRTSLQAVEMPLKNVTQIGSNARAVPQPNTCATGAPIYEPSLGRKSITGVTKAAATFTSGDGLPREARRSHLFSWEYDTDQGGITVTATTYPGSSQFFELPPTVLARHLYEGVTTATVSVYLLAEAEGAPNTAAIKVTAGGGSSCSIDISGITPTWYTGTLSVRTEDLSRNGTDGGIRGGARETLTVVGKVTGGTNYLRMCAFYVVEQE